MRTLLLAFLSLLLVTYSNNSAIASTNINTIPDCIVLTHCVRVDWIVTNVDDSFEAVVEAVASTPRTKIIEQTDSYLHAEATTKWMRYVDDLEINLIHNKNLLQIRSESRVGLGDMGVNQKRIDDLADRLKKIKIIKEAKS